MPCNCGGSTSPAQAQRLAHAKQPAGPGPRTALPPVPLRSDGPGDRSGGYYAKPPVREVNGPPLPDRA